MIAERDEDLEAKFEDLQAGTLHKNETSVNNPDPQVVAPRIKMDF